MKHSINLEQHIKKISQYIWKVKFTIFQNLNWNLKRSRCFRGIKIRYDLFNNLVGYRDIMQFHINSTRESR